MKEDVAAKRARTASARAAAASRSCWIQPNAARPNTKYSDAAVRNEFGASTFIARRSSSSARPSSNAPQTARNRPTIQRMRRVEPVIDSGSGAALAGSAEGNGRSTVKRAIRLFARSPESVEGVRHGSIQPRPAGRRRLCQQERAEGGSAPKGYRQSSARRARKATGPRVHAFGITPA